ncbi:hypothetical protein HN587_06475 [Candidatus Woesearchaeota archaeon]|jgi:hypothetical protein|nr:hypothetical protein [Candidatus Woesearchaeota archaeon]
MKKEVLILLVIVFTLILPISIAIDTYDDVVPHITADFQENVTIINSSLINIDAGQSYSLSNNSLLDMPKKQYVFFPIIALQNGVYQITLQAKDQVGNIGTYSWPFEIYKKPNSVELLKPRLGVSNTTYFEVLLSTGETSYCKSSSQVPQSFESILLKKFDLTGISLLNPDTYESTHKFLNYTITPAPSQPFYVYCKDNLGRENFKSFTLYTDLTPPNIVAKTASPNPVLEYPVEGKLRSTITAITNEPAICKYSLDSNETYSDMSGEFDNWTQIYDLIEYSDDLFNSFTTENKVTLEYPSNITKQDFKYYIICEDRAGWKSTKKEFTLKVDLTSALSIKIETPPSATNNPAVFLNITTNKRAYCLYKTGNNTYDSGQMSSSSVNLANTHTKNLGTLSSGTYSYKFRCIVPPAGEVEQQSKEKSYTFIIDTTPPSKPIINTTDFVCKHELSGSFLANDTHTSIDEYVWQIFTSGLVLANGTSSDTVTVSKTNNGSNFVLDKEKQYFFKVYAIDAAGNSGQTADSLPISYDDTGIKCDTTPPTITVDKSPLGESVIINCYDNQSGCGIMNYGVALQEPCNVSKVNFAPVTIPLTSTIIVCWDVSDIKGNVNKGVKKIVVNGTGLDSSLMECIGGTDNDGDGRGELCPAGPDCDDTDSNFYIGCLSGCVQDTDGDKYGRGCTIGNDCHDRDENLTTICPNGCVSDNDGDEYGLGCSKGHDCRGIAFPKTNYCPNGCISDNDGDNYGFGCPAGLDCNGEDPNFLTQCTNGCISDLDGDGYGIGCETGPDCNGADQTTNAGCENLCINDEDGDGYGFGCTLGSDCDNVNQLYTTECPDGCLVDNDGDGYGWGECSPDCDDTDYSLNMDCVDTTNCVVDLDGDGMGLGCEAGPDCNDLDTSVDNTQCVVNCSFDLDCDRLPDNWEQKYSLNETLINEMEDPDSDEIINLDEYRQNSDPTKKDEKQVSQESETKFNPDEDGDGILDECESRNPSVLSNKDLYDADKDPDADGLTNKEECAYIQGLCSYGTNPAKADTDGDGANDKKEIDALTDPCDPTDKPSSGMGLWLILLGLLLIIVSTCFIVYKKYYLILIAPPPAPVQNQQVAKPLFRRTAIKHPMNHPGAGKFPLRRPHKPSGPRLSHDKYADSVKSKLEERKKMLDVFGDRKKVEHSKIMEKLARKKEEKVHLKPLRKNDSPKPQVVEKLEEKKIEPEHIKQLNKVIDGGAFDKLTDLTKKQVDEFGKLAGIVAQRAEQKKKLSDDQVHKLAKITQKLEEHKLKKKEVEKAVKSADFDKLDNFLNTKQQLKTFMRDFKEDQTKKKVEEKAEEDAFDSLSKLSGQHASKKTAMDKLSELRGDESKQELFETVKKMSKEAHVDKNVFQVLLNYLMKSGKINKKEVAELLFDLEKQKVFDSKDIADVFFNLGLRNN